MEELEEEKGLPNSQPEILSPCSSGRSKDSNSPEFEFWNIMRNPNSFPESNILSADELFSDGVLLPLDQLHVSAGAEMPAPEPAEPDGVGPKSTAAAGPAINASKRWRDIIIFRKSGTSADGTEKAGLMSSVKKSGKKWESSKKSGNNGGALAKAAELNINIWPFKRSISAGNGGPRPRGGVGRKVSSAPCSRSNSGGDSKTRKLPSSPGRVNDGVHLGRTSPVWKIRRGGGGGGGGVPKSIGEKCLKKDEGVDVPRKQPPPSAGGKRVVLSLNVPMCIGYRSHLSCKSNENSAVSAAASAVGGDGAIGGGGAVAGEGVRGGGNMFGIRSLFTKKVY